MPETSSTAALQEALHRFLSGDSGAKAALVEKAYGRLLILARTHLRRFPVIRRDEDTAAILNASYHKISRALEEVRPASVSLFLGLAALQIRRILLDLSDRRPAAGPLPSDVSPVARERGRVDEQVDIVRALDQLSEDDRELVNLLFYMGLTQAEAAEIIGVHEDTIKRRWAKVRMRLATVLQAYDVEV